MNTIIESKPLIEALKLCARICNKNASLPILAHALIEVRDDKTEITVTDLDQTLIVTVPSGQGKAGKCCAPLHRLQRAVVASSKKEVRLEYNEKTGLKVSNGATFTVLTLHPDEFPPTPKLKTQDFTITAGNLRLLVKSTGYAQSTDPARHVINSVCFEPHKGMLRAIATDGRRLSLMETSCAWTQEQVDPLRLLVRSDTVDFPQYVPVQWQGRCHRR